MRVWVVLAAAAVLSCVAANGDPFHEARMAEMRELERIQRMQNEPELKKDAVTPTQEDAAQPPQGHVVSANVVVSAPEDAPIPGVMPGQSAQQPLQPSPTVAVEVAVSSPAPLSPPSGDQQGAAGVHAPDSNSASTVPVQPPAVVAAQPQQPQQEPPVAAGNAPRPVLTRQDGIAGDAAAPVSGADVAAAAAATLNAAHAEVVAASTGAEAAGTPAHDPAQQQQHAQTAQQPQAAPNAAEDQHQQQQRRGRVGLAVAGEQAGGKDAGHATGTGTGEVPYVNSESWHGHKEGGEDSHGKPPAPAAAAAAGSAHHAASTQAGSASASGSGEHHEEGTVEEHEDDDHTASLEDDEDEPDDSDTSTGITADEEDVDPAAFQPSHILSFNMKPGETAAFYDDCSKEQIGTLVRGDWFVTAGDDELSLEVIVIDPTGAQVYREGPANPSGAPVSQGSFSFPAKAAGTYTILLRNPAYNYPRTVAFAWLLGPDPDDSFAVNEANPNGMTPANISRTIYELQARVSSLHKRLDEIVALQQYGDVRFKRHMQTVDSTQRRFLWSTAGEALAVLAFMALQILFFRTLNIQPMTIPSAFAGGSLPLKSMASGGPSTSSGSSYYGGGSRPPGFSPV